jgi:hypothetical protein
MLDKLTSADFSTLLNQTFQVRLGSDELFVAELIDVTELGQAPSENSDVNRRAFSTIFRVAHQETFFQQQICEVQHDALGTLTLFLVPLGPDNVGMRYEAMFT